MKEERGVHVQLDALDFEGLNLVPTEDAVEELQTSEKMEDGGSEYPAILTLVPFSNYVLELEKQFRSDDIRDPNKLLGFPLTKFKQLASHTDGLQPGFYLLGAETNIGKTAFLTNMCMDVLETNPNLTVIYLSLDDSRKSTSYRFLSIITQLGINECQKKLTDISKSRIQKDGRNKLIELACFERLIVKDTSEVSTSAQLISEIEACKDKSNLVVFIDGLHNLLVDDNINGGIREVNIERARIVKYIGDKFKVPVITTGEVRKKGNEEGKDKAPTIHDLMETSKYAYNANVVWLLYGKSDDLKKEEPILTLEYAKNKLSDYKGTQELLFKRATGTMIEVSGKCNSSRSFQNDKGGLE
jgi:replicative DNA helicase